MESQGVQTLFDMLPWINVFILFCFLCEFGEKNMERVTSLGAHLSHTNTYHMYTLEVQKPFVLYH